MKRIMIVLLVLLFGVIGSANAESSKDVYKAVKKAELKSTGTQKDVDNVVADARAEFDLFKDSKDAKKNPEFTKHIEAALNALRVAQFSKEVTQNSTDWKKNMDLAAKELERAKSFLK